MDELKHKVKETYFKTKAAVIQWYIENPSSI